LAVHWVTKHFIGPRQRIGHWQCGNRSFSILDGIQQAVDDAVRAKRSGSIMDQDGVGLDFAESGANAVGTLCTSDNKLSDQARAQRMPRHIVLAFTDHHPNGIDCRM
jgi:hypothetical protein